MDSRVAVAYGPPVEPVRRTFPIPAFPSIPAIIKHKRTSTQVDVTSSHFLITGRMRHRLNNRPHIVAGIAHEVISVSAVPKHCGHDFLMFHHSIAVLQLHPPVEGEGGCFSHLQGPRDPAPQGDVPVPVTR